MAVSLGFAPGQVVQEFYVDDDADETLRQQIEEDTGRDIVDVEYDDIVDGAIIWWRADDAEEEDLGDLLVDAVSNLDDHGGLIWVLSPKAGRTGAVLIGEIEEAATNCGLQTTSATAVADEWSGVRLVSRARTR